MAVSTARARAVLVLAAMMIAPAAHPAATPGEPAVASRTPGAPPAGDHALDRLRLFLERMHSMRASFRQELVNGDQQVIEESRGRVVLQRPGRFRWDYEQPYQRVVVADGKQLWLYEADLEQVTVRPLAAGLGETPAALLTGEQSILERFEFVSSWSGDQVNWVRLKPRSADSDFDSIAVGFSGERLVQLEINDRLGQQTRVYLSNIELNVRVAEDSFLFQVPAGVDVIREGEL